MKVTFSSTHNAFQVIAPKGTLISLSATPTALADGVYVIGDEGVINIDDQQLTDSIYLSTVGSDYTVANGQRVAYPLGDDSVIVRAGGSAIPFKMSGKGGGTGSIFRTTTVLTDGATTNPIEVNGESVTVKSGDFAVYNTQEFLFDGTQWNLLGDRVGLGDLAYKSSATGTAITSAGTLPSLTYDSVNERLIFNAGTLPTEGTVTVS